MNGSAVGKTSPGPDNRCPECSCVKFGIFVYPGISYNYFMYDYNPFYDIFMVKEGEDRFFWKMYGFLSWMTKRTS